MKLKIKLILLFLFIITAFSGCNKLSDNDIIRLPSPNPGASVTEAPTTGAPLPTLIPTPTPTETAIPTPDSSVPSPSPKGEPVVTDNTEKARELIKDMSIEEKVGQMFFARCIKAQALADIDTYQPGGYILFGADFQDQSKKEIKTTISGYQKEASIPMLIGVDEEGGTVNRISKYPAFRSVPFPSPQDLYQKGGFDLIISDTREKAELLKELGINVNLAPVCDVSTNPEDFIYRRSFGKAADKTAEYVKTVVTEMNRDRIGSTLKHFPGYGNNVDTHTGIAIDERSYESFVKKDFLPFQAGIEAGAGSILVSHNIVTSMDPDYPASLSGKVHTVLREELGFQGVIMTDDLSMDAIKEYTNDKEAAVLAIMAGNDLLIATDYNIQIPAVLAAVENGSITENRIDESVTRILKWKLDLGIMQ